MSEQPLVAVSENGYDRNGTRYARVTHVLKSVGIIDPRWFDEYAALRGTYVHMACAMHDVKTLDYENLDPQLVGYVNGWMLFLKEHPQIEIKDIEKFVWDDTLKVAGTLDRTAMIRSSKGIIDIKAATSLDSAVEIQTAGYARMEGEVDWRMAVQLFPDGTYQQKSLTKAIDKSIWLSACNIWNWKLAKGKERT
jgi:hypothetical protein